MTPLQLRKLALQSISIYDIDEGHALEQGFHVPVWSVIYLLLELIILKKEFDNVNFNVT